MSADLFHDLFIFEIANNHQGNLQHGLNLIRALGAVARQEKIKAAIKFQFRELETFLSEHHRQNSNALASRFISTALTPAEFGTLLEEVKAQNLLSMCTPFDEPSANRVKEMGFDLVKVASCSATDVPLLQKVASLNMPTVASTAGLSLPQVDNLVHILGADRAPLAIMHCVALYPTENHELRLERISELKDRFPALSVGFSTHERPDNLMAVQMAYAQGAQLFEKHVGLPSAETELNAYSASPEQLIAWIRAWKLAKAACNSSAPAQQTKREAHALGNLKRACFAAQPIKKGDALGAHNVTFSLCLSPFQLLVENFRSGSVANRNYEAQEPIQMECELGPHIAQLKNLLSASGLELSRELTVEVSHHYGVQRFNEAGAFILPLPGDSLRKLLVLMPNQSHPAHFHEEKSETFRVLHGSIELEINGRSYHLDKGDEMLIPKRSWHKFTSLEGAVIEELADLPTFDSFYQDSEIQTLPRQERKTFVPFA